METINFNKGWVLGGKPITLPHDAMLYEKRDAKAKDGAAAGYFTGGVYEYEKTFTALSDWSGKRVTFRFEGVYKNSTVYINGQEAGGCAYGYSQFYVSASAALNYGAENTIKVIARNDDQPNSRWYTGSGIYRPVWLIIGEIISVKVSTVSSSPAVIFVDSECDVEILDSDTVIATGKGEITIPNAKLWSDETPYLYKFRVGEYTRATAFTF
jgi:beta-galactosidase/beta-glucuronidase